MQVGAEFRFDAGKILKSVFQGGQNGGDVQFSIPANGTYQGSFLIQDLGIIQQPHLVFHLFDLVRIQSRLLQLFHLKPIQLLFFPKLLFLTT